MRRRSLMSETIPKEWWSDAVFYAPFTTDDKDIIGNEVMSVKQGVTFGVNGMNITSNTKCKYSDETPGAYGYSNSYIFYVMKLKSFYWESYVPNTSVAKYIHLAAVCMTDGRHSYWNWSFCFHGTNHTTILTLSNSNNNATDRTLGWNLSTNTKHKFCITLDNENGICKFYIDGVLKNTLDYKASTREVGDNSWALVPAGARYPFWIDYSRNNVGGTIKDLCAWDFVLDENRAEKLTTL